MVLICFLPISDVTASRDLNDYVITEKWRDVEQALPGDTKILPIWMAWGSVQYEVCAYLLIVYSFRNKHCVYVEFKLPAVPKAKAKAKAISN